MKFLIWALSIWYCAAAYAQTRDLGAFDYPIRSERIHRSSTYWFPLSSFGVPGLGQYLNRQHTAGMVYSGAALFGIFTTIHGATRMPNGELGSLTLDNLNKTTDPEKEILWGLQTYQTAGSVSTYHAFRSVVEQRKSRGDFAFITQNETPDQLFWAPFDVRHLLRPTTLIPLALLSALLVHDHNTNPGAKHNLGTSDAFFTVGSSYNAGLGEEALFRGYLMMNLRQSWGSDLWSNAATATIFGAAHISPSNNFPLAQAIMGFYFGWLTQRNKWTLSESIFLHTWWDIIAIGATLAEGPAARAVYLPIVQYGF